MGTFMEEITLENSTDRENVNRGYINESQIRNLKVEAIPDTGAWTLVINEEIRQKLGLTIKSEVQSTLADGKTSNYPITEAVSIQWKNRNTELPAVVVADAKKVLLGALPLEAMDLIVDPVHQTLAGAHGDEPLYILC
ncbi:MAG: retroviral-like aspartic protease family protein [Treponema sp.]|nr:retroviral-like aspartic protease family protein [Treponema sp.]